MAIFLKEDDLNNELSRLVEEADDFLFIVSPYIKMHQRFKDELSHKRKHPELRIVFLFGKNEDDRSKSIDKADIDFLKDFPNIKIAHKKELHAKFYASEDFAIITSLNLYSSSQSNNIEAGILLYPPNAIRKLTNTIASGSDGEAYETALAYFEKVIDTSEILFEKRPEYDKQFFKLTPKYRESVVTEDKLDSIFTETGYCIRTGVKIAFNVRKPMSIDAYNSWVKFGNKDYPEKYCHFSGEVSNGETSFNKPILKKNWAMAKTVHGSKIKSK